MSKWNPIQESFASGEISPRFYAQQSTDLYRQGLLECFNMIPTPQGPVTRRRGTTIVKEITSSLGLPNANARIFPGNFTEDDWLLMVLSGGRIEVITSATASATKKQIVQNPNFDESITNWAIGNVGWDVRWIYQVNLPAGPRINLISANGSTISMDQQVTVDEANDVAQLRYRLIDERQDYTGKINRCRTTISKTAAGEAPFIYDKTDYFQSKGQQVSINVDVALGTGYSGPLYIRFQVDSDTPGSVWEQDINNISVISCEMDIVVTPPTEIPIMDTGYTDNHIDQIQYVQNPFERQVVFVHPLYPPKELTFDGTAWTWQDITFTGTPTWTEQTGYPRTCGAYQGRLVLGGWDSDPQRLVMSKPGDWRDFTVPATDPTAADGIDITLTEVGIIQWNSGQKECLAGTLNGEQVIRSETGLIQPGDIQANMQSAYGSKHMQGADIGDQLLYASTDGLKVRAAEYVDDAKGWTSQDLTYIAEHITKSGVKRIAYTRDPQQIFWCVLANGWMAAATYERGLNLIGWHKHNTWGLFLDACSLRVNGTDVPYFVVTRTINGVRKIFLERMDEIVDPNLNQYMDWMSHHQFGAPVSTISGLEYAEGMTLGVYADGAMQENQLVEGGAITLQHPASNVSLGFFILARIKTLPAVASAKVGGMGSMKNYTEIGLRLFESAPPVINGTQLPDRTSTSPMGQRETDVNGDLYQLDMGTDSEAQVTVRQGLPLPLTITGLYGRLSVSDL